MTKMQAGKISVSVVGARGYSGLELTRLLLRHPQAQLAACFATQSFNLADFIIDARAAKIPALAQDQLMANLTDVVFLATPPEASLELAPKILKAGKKVIDLSGAFRLKKSDYTQWYKFDHNEKALLAEAQYGLAPFCGPTAANLIANPGCYATAILMGLLPLLQNDLIETDSLVIDAKSGASGAGRKAAENLLFSEVTAECLPYRVGRHQHTPEILEAVGAFAGASIDPHFSTHLLPVDRGLIAGLYAKAKTTDVKKIAAAFDTAFASYPLVRHQAGIGALAKLQNVVKTPYTHISYELVGNKLYLFSAIDNLMKGAASQAVENFNRLLDAPLTAGLEEN